MDISLDVLKEVVCKETGVLRSSFDSGKRFPKTCDARKLFIMLAMDVCQYRQSEVAEFMGLDHSTVISAAQRGNDLVSVYASFECQFNRIKTALQDYHTIDQLSHDAVLVRLRILELQLSEKIKEIDQIIKSIS